MTITDSPRFTWRGIMIDSGRKPRSIAELKTIIDLLACYKVNTIHWHLTEDQGWRLEIKDVYKRQRHGNPQIFQSSGRSTEIPDSQDLHSVSYTHLPWSSVRCQWMVFTL